MNFNLKSIVTFSALAFLAAGCAQQPTQTTETAVSEPAATAISNLPRVVEPSPDETHFGELRMLTDGGENAEAYFSFAGDQLIFQSTRPPYDCDQIFTMDLETAETTLVSTGTGRTTCAYFLPGDHWIIYASTHLASPECPPPPDMSRGYVWPIDPGYDIFRAKRRRLGSNASPRRRATTPRPRSRRRATRSSSPRCATAISISTP